jgi:hypothetical protein
MARIPELYIPEQDQLSRDQGTVYIADLMASHVLVSLKQNCAPQGLGFMRASPVSPDEAKNLHTQMSEALGAHKEGHFQGLYIGDIAVRRCIDEPELLEFKLDYWDGRPVKTTLVTGPETDSTTLTGFQAFDPWTFDRDQGPGAAQKTVDALRATNDSSSLEVQVLEGGRTFDCLKGAKSMLLGHLLRALEGNENPEFSEDFARALEQYEALIEEK